MANILFGDGKLLESIQTGVGLETSGPENRAELSKTQSTRNDGRTFFGNVQRFADLVEKVLLTTRCCGPPERIVNPPLETSMLDLNSEEETEALGLRLGGRLQPGDTVALIGPLGAGKTRLVKAIARGLDVPAELVNSPTFMLIQEYPGRIPLRHCDVYRLKSPQEFPELGLDELFAADGVALIEWADRVADDLPPERLEIRLEPIGLTARRVHLLGHGERGRELARHVLSDGAY